MPYLSRVWINPRRAKAREYMANPQVVHASVLAGLVKQPTSGRVLWRLGVERSGDGRHAYRAELLILTESRPSLQHIVEEAGFVGADGSGPVTRNYSRLLTMLSDGDEYAFMARVNPTRSTAYPTKPTPRQQVVLARNPGRHRGFRLPERTVDQQTAWLTDRSGDRWGFEVPVSPTTGALDIRIVDRGRLDFFKGPRDATRHHVRITTVTFEGRLRVTDVARLRAALLGGIGPGKAYGCGLLTLAPLEPSGLGTEQAE